MFNKKDPVIMSTVTLIITFVILVGILYLAKPFWVQVVDQNTGKKSISGQLVLSYSATFALVCSIAVFLIVSNKQESQNMVSYNSQAFFLPPVIASSYCGVRHSA